MNSPISYSTVEPRMPSRPKSCLPALACDCHTHAFGPFDRFPVRHLPHYPLPNAPVTRLLDMLDQIGVARAVLVQPAPYGTDPSLIVEGLKSAPLRLRGILVADATMTASQMEQLDLLGGRGLRFVEARTPQSERLAGSVGFDQIPALALPLKNARWHAQLWGPASAYLEHLPGLVKLGVPLVLDHFGAVRPSLGTTDPMFRLLRDLLADGLIWIKLQLCRVSSAYPDYAELREMHDILIDTNPDQVLWGSDWPYVRMGQDSPDVAVLVDQLVEWVPNPDLRQRLLVDNPARLYRF